MACISSVLMCGTLLKVDAWRLDAFRSILAISRTQQWEEQITSRQVREFWGDSLLLSVRLQHRQLEWLGHIARMPHERYPLQLLIGRLPQPKHFCGPHHRCKDVCDNDTQQKSFLQHGIVHNGDRSQPPSNHHLTRRRQSSVLPANDHFPGRQTLLATNVWQNVNSRLICSVVPRSVQLVRSGATARDVLQYPNAKLSLSSHNRHVHLCRPSLSADH